MKKRNNKDSKMDRIACIGASLCQLPDPVRRIVFAHVYFDVWRMEMEKVHTEMNLRTAPRAFEHSGSYSFHEIMIAGKSISWTSLCDHLTDAEYLRSAPVIETLVLCDEEMTRRVDPPEYAHIYEFH